MNGINLKIDIMVTEGISMKETEQLQKADKG